VIAPIVNIEGSALRYETFDGSRAAAFSSSWKTVVNR
jgi:hypothetical protein